MTTGQVAYTACAMLATASAQVCVPLGHSSLITFCLRLLADVGQTSSIPGPLEQDTPSTTTTAGDGDASTAVPATPSASAHTPGPSQQHDDSPSISGSIAKANISFSELMQTPKIVRKTVRRKKALIIKQIALAKNCSVFSQPVRFRKAQLKTKITHWVTKQIPVMSL